jgi:predicted transposase YbfD/YdcC
MRSRLPSLVAPVVCAMTPAGHDSITAAAEWCRRAAPEEPAAFGLPCHPLPGRYRVPGEKTPRSVPGRLDPAEPSAAGFACPKSPLPGERAVPAPLMPDGGPEREQRRAHQAAAQADPVRRGRRAIAVDGKCLRGARRPDGRRVFVLSAVRHGDGITLASRGIGAKTNGIPEFAPLLDQVDDVDLAGAVITADALHAQRSHAAYPRERGAHYLLTIKNNQRGQARRPHRLPWKEVPVIHRDDARGHRRHEQRPVRVVTVDGLLFPHAPARSRASSADAACTGRRSGPARPSTPSPTCPPSRPQRQRPPPGPAGTGPWRTPSTGCAMSSSARTTPRSEPVIRPPCPPPSAT